jgi:hypothetical protein
MSEHSGVTGKTPMARIQKTIAMLGGAAALAFAVGFTGVGVSSLGSTTAPTPHLTASVAPRPTKAPSKMFTYDEPPNRPDEWLAH